MVVKKKKTNKLLNFGDDGNSDFLELDQLLLWCLRNNY